MDYFNSAELAQLVSGYESRNGVGIENELELMSALAASGVRCSVGVEGLRAFLLEEYERHERELAASSFSKGHARPTTVMVRTRSGSLTPAGAPGNEGPAPSSAPSGMSGSGVQPDAPSLGTSGNATMAGSGTTAPSQLALRRLSARGAAVTGLGLTRKLSALRSASIRPPASYGMFSSRTSIDGGESSKKSDRDTSARGTGVVGSDRTALPSWMSLRFPISSADLVMLTLFVKQALFRAVVDEANIRGKSGCAAKDAAILWITEATTDGANDPAVQALHLGEEVVETTDIGSDSALFDAAHRESRNSDIKGRGDRGIPQGLSSTRAAAGGARRRAGGPPHSSAYVAKILSLPQTLRRKRVVAMDALIHQFHGDLCNILESAADAAGGGVAESSSSSPRGQGGAAKWGRDEDGRAWRSSASAAAIANEVADTPQPLLSASVMGDALSSSARRGGAGGAHAALQKILQRYNLDSRLVLSTFDGDFAANDVPQAKHGGALRGIPAGGHSTDSVGIAELSSGADAIDSKSESVSPLSPSFVVPASIGPVSTGGGGSAAAVSGASTVTCSSFATWLLAKQQFIVQELTAVAVPGTSSAVTPTPDFGQAASPGMSSIAQSPFSLTARRGVLGGLTTAAASMKPLDEDQFLQRSSSEAEIRLFDARTPRRGDHMLSGLHPLDQVVERCRNQVRAMRAVVPLELQFPYSPVTAAKDVKQVTTVDEMLDDMCNSTRDSKVHTVATALRSLRHRRLNPHSADGLQDNRRARSVGTKSVSSTLLRQSAPPDRASSPSYTMAAATPTHGSQSPLRHGSFGSSRSLRRLASTRATSMAVSVTDPSDATELVFAESTTVEHTLPPSSTEESERLEPNSLGTSPPPEGIDDPPPPSQSPFDAADSEGSVVVGATQDIADEPHEPQPQQQADEHGQPPLTSNGSALVISATSSCDAARSEPKSDLQMAFWLQGGAPALATTVAGRPKLTGSQRERRGVASAATPSALHR